MMYEFNPGPEKGQKDNAPSYVRPELLNTIMGLRTKLLAPTKCISVCSLLLIFLSYASILFQHQYTLLPNTSTKSAALEAKFEIAVKTLLKVPNLTVQEAMLVAKFSTKDIENKVCRKL